MLNAVANGFFKMVTFDFGDPFQRDNFNAPLRRGFHLRPAATRTVVDSGRGSPVDNSIYVGKCFDHVAVLSIGDVAVGFQPTKSARALTTSVTT